MSLVLVVLLPFIGALLPALMIRAGRNACATSTFTITLLVYLALSLVTSLIVNIANRRMALVER